jgi:hypothetical protein
MNDTDFEIISAFVEGDAVDPDALARTLADPRARTLLADFLKLRAATDQKEELPPSLIRLRSPRAAFWSARVPLPAAVMLALLAGAATLAVSERMPVDAQGPPSATRAVRFEPGVDWQTVTGSAARP